MEIRIVNWSLHVDINSILERFHCSCVIAVQWSKCIEMQHKY